MDRVGLVIDDPDVCLSEVFRSEARRILEEIRAVHNRVLEIEKELKRRAKEDRLCRLVSTVPGVGPITATAYIAAVGNGSWLKNGRNCAAWLGLVPRQNSSGSTIRLGRITKRGDRYLRSLLVHGARTVLLAARSEDPDRKWLLKVSERRGFHRATVAQANRTARVMWAVLNSGEPYKAAI